MSGYVYFAQAFGGGPIKIGLSADPKRRISNLNTASPQRLDLLAVLPGGVWLERCLHGLFQKDRLHGEWFAADAPGLAELIETVVAPEWAGRTHPELHSAVAAIQSNAALLEVQP